MSLRCTMILGDCLEVMPELKDSSVDFCFADLPYGSTGFHWDVELCANKLWGQLSRINTGPVVLTANEKFHIKMLDAWRKHFRYTLIWEKFAPCNFLHAKYRPMLSHEFVAVYGKTPVYVPQKTYGHLPYKKTKEKITSAFISGYSSRDPGSRRDGDDSRHPRSILYFRRDRRTRDKYTPSGTNRRSGTHPSQKPVALLDWLIRSYSLAGATILDPVGGSGTTAHAAVLAGRSAVSIEKDRGYHDASVDRIRKVVKDNALDVAIEVRQ